MNTSNFCITVSEHVLPSHSSVLPETAHFIGSCTKGQ